MQQSKYKCSGEINLKFMADAGFICHGIPEIIAASMNENKNTLFFSELRYSK
jgi:hypothetical protein